MGRRRSKFFIFQNDLTRIVMIVLCLLLLTGLLLIDQLQSCADEPNVIRVYAEDGATETVAFEGLALIPGSFSEYTVKLRSDGAKRCSLTMDFVETQQGTLKDLARVKIVSEGTVLYDELLSDLFEGDGISLPVRFGQDKTACIKIVYYLPADVGSEAKDAKTTFDLRLTVYNG